MLIIETISTTLSKDALDMLVTDRLDYFNELLDTWGLSANFLQHQSGGEQIIQIVTSPAAWQYLDAIGELN